MRLPKKVELCPIIDYACEIKFTASVPYQAVFGVIYQALQQDYNNYEALPITQLPEAIRNSDPSLRFKPHYRITNGFYHVQIGPDVIVIGGAEYSGWDQFSKEIAKCFTQVNNTGVIKSINQVGLRYVNFFDNTDIYQHIKLHIAFNSQPLLGTSTIIRTEIPDDDFIKVLQIANNTQITKLGNFHTGSVIDIDVITDERSIQFSQLESLIDQSHTIEKQLFYSLLKENFLETLKPVY